MRSSDTNEPIDPTFSGAPNPDITIEPARKLSHWPDIVAAVATLSVLLLIGWSVATVVISNTSGPAQPLDREGVSTTEVTIPEPQKISDQLRAALPRATSSANVVDAPSMPSATALSDRRIDLDQPVIGYRVPGGPPIALILDRDSGSANWLPVLASRPGWDQVLLPSRPHGSTAWVDARDIHVHATPTPDRIIVAAARTCSPIHIQAVRSSLSNVETLTCGCN